MTCRTVIAGGVARHSGRNVVELSHCDLVDEIVRDDVHRLIELMAADASS